MCLTLVHRIQFRLVFISWIACRTSVAAAGCWSQSMNGNHLSHEYAQYPSVFSRLVGRSLTAYSTAALRASSCTFGESRAFASCSLSLPERPSSPATLYSNPAGNPLALACTSASPRLLTPVTCAGLNQQTENTFNGVFEKKKAVIWEYDHYIGEGDEAVINRDLAVDTAVYIIIKVLERLQESYR